MKATYLGGNNNGFVKFETYDIHSRLQFVSIPYGNVYKQMICICIYNSNGDNFIPYKNLEEVLCNWKF
jgi:hypothetical protein